MAQDRFPIDSCICSKIKSRFRLVGQSINFYVFFILFQANIVSSALLVSLSLQNVDCMLERLGIQGNRRETYLVKHIERIKMVTTPGPGISILTDLVVHLPW